MIYLEIIDNLLYGMFAISWLLNHNGRTEDSFHYASCAIIFGGKFLLNVAMNTHLFPVIYGCLSVGWVWMWWKNRRNGKWKQAAKELGAKSRARVQALVRNMTPSPLPSPAGA